MKAPEESSARAFLRTLLVSDLVGSTALVEELGDERASTVFARHDRLARDILKRFSGREIDKTDGFLLLFERPIDAVGYAVAYHLAMQELSRDGGIDLRSRVGIHVGEVFLRENTPEDVALGAKPLEVEGLAKPITARLMSLALGGQTLLTQGAFDLARRAAVDDSQSSEQLRWIAHGDYRFKGVDEAVAVFEVGQAGVAPLEAPPDSEKAKRDRAENTILGWRPAPGQEIPHRPHWRLERKLGEGGFGEVWLGVHRKTRDRRVFKFCFEAERLRALQREVTLFRLLKEALGNRNDIARILDWNFDEAPFFVESEFTEGGSLIDWARDRGGIASIDLGIRLEIVAQVAEALAAAHSVGVLHKDIKPGNILVTENRDSEIQVRLTDFGIGLVTDVARLSSHGITAMGFTETSLGTDDSTGGTFQYMAPELLEGQPATVQADIYALGVLSYQLIVGRLNRVMAPGWEREIDDEILREDIAEMVDGSPDRRPRDAAEIASRFRSVDARRQKREAERIEIERAVRDRKALEKARRRRKSVVAVVAFLVVFSGAMAFLAQRISIEAERANREAENARQVSDFLVSIFEVSDPEAGRGGTVTARELLDQGARKAQSQLADQPLTLAVLLDAMGTSYLQLGLYSRAAPLLKEALTIRRDELGNEHPSTLISMRNLGRLLTAQGEYDEAERQLRSVLRGREGLFEPDDRRIAVVLQDLADLYRKQGRHAEALPLARRAKEILGTDRTREMPNVLTRDADSNSFSEGWSLPVPADADLLLGASPERDVVYLRSAQGVYQIDLEGKLAPILTSIPAGAVVEGWIAYTGPVLRIGDRMLLRRLFARDGAVEDVVLAEGVEKLDRLFFDRNGRRIAILRNGTFTVFENAASGVTVLARIEAEQRVDVASVSDRFIAFAGPDGLAVHSIDEGRLILQAQDWAGLAKSVAIHDPSGMVAVGGWFDEVAIYDLENGGEPQILNLSGMTYGLSFLSDAPSLIVSKEGRLDVWRPGTGLVATFEEPAACFGKALFEKNGLLVLDGCSHRLRSFSYRSVAILDEFEISSAVVWSIAADPSGAVVFAGASDGQLHRYDLESGKLRSIVAHSQGVTSLVQRPGAVVSGGDDKTIAAWDSESLTELGRTQAHRSLVNFMQWEDSAGLLWTSSSDGFIKAWSWPDLLEQKSIHIGSDAKGAFWIDSGRGRLLVGTWAHNWFEARLDDSWSVVETVEVPSLGTYAAVHLEVPDVVFMLGIQPTSCWLWDRRSSRYWEVPSLDQPLIWAAGYGDGESVLAFGANAILLYRFTRSGEQMRFEVRSTFDSRLGETAAGVPVLGGKHIAVGTADGRLLVIDVADAFTTTLFSGQL